MDTIDELHEQDIRDTQVRPLVRIQGRLVKYYEYELENTTESEALDLVEEWIYAEEDSPDDTEVIIDSIFVS